MLGRVNKRNIVLLVYLTGTSHLVLVYYPRAQYYLNPGIDLSYTGTVKEP
jgi:hypothetical protein